LVSRPLIDVGVPRYGGGPFLGAGPIGGLKGVEATAGHEPRLIPQDVADRPDLAAETQTCPQKMRRGERPAVAEPGKGECDQGETRQPPFSSRVTKSSCASAQRSPSSLMSLGIDSLLEGGVACPPQGVQEPLALAPLFQIGLDNRLDGVGHPIDRKSRAKHLADRGILGPGTAEGQLVEFLTLLVDAQDADVAHVVYKER